MKLRNRLARNALLAIGLIGVTVYNATDLWREYQADRMLARAVAAAMAGDGRVRCEGAPGKFGGGELPPIPAILPFGPQPNGHPQIFAYDKGFRSANAAAPDFPYELQSELAAGANPARAEFVGRYGIGRSLAVRTPWTEGPCAVLLSRFDSFPIPFSTEMTRLALVIFIFVSAAVVAAGPTIARVQRLTAAVRISAESMYETRVPETRLDEIGELERAFNRAGEQVKSHVATIAAREAALRAAVANTTHDVAVPLTVVQGHLSALQGLLPSRSPAQDDLRAAIRETHYLAALLHNLAVAARLETTAPTIERQPVDLSAVVERVFARHRPLAASLGIALDRAVPERAVSVIGDATLLEQAASNLVHNAVHYNRSGGHVAMVLDLDDDGRCFALRVIDDGPGIPSEERALLTQRAFRGATGRATRPNGQGLGLHIVREVVECHGFALEIGDSEYGGAEVVISGGCEPLKGHMAAPSTQPLTFLGT